jgi:arylsulfatase A-like enzyme
MRIENRHRGSTLSWLTVIAALAALIAPANAADKKPNILVIWGDDIGTLNISHNNRGMMGYRTPNIDRVAREGVAFTDYYAQQSCTAGRAAFISGSVPVRSGMTKVGMPGAKEGWQKTDVTMATVLKSQGYSTGQFGKNHQGDRDEHLPTMHGFDEFLGSLYHLNAEEEPEQRDYPRDMKLRNGKTFLQQFGPRGVIKSKADGKGGQTIENLGPLTKKRMETIDEESLAAAKDFIVRQHKAGKPFFCWWNGTRMHLYTHVRPEYKGRSGLSEYMDGMLEHDGQVGNLLKTLDDLGLANNTIVIYGTDNGVHMNSWPDGGMTPFRSEKNTNWEGAYRVPAMIRWPGRIKPGQASNEIFAALDWFPTLLAAAGEPEIKNKLLTGYVSGGKTFKVHLDGYNQLPLLTGQQEKSARKEFFYINDDAQLVAMRYENWKMVFCEQRAPGTLRIWAEPFVCLRLPKLINLRLDPYERADITSNTYYDWAIQRAFLIVPAQAMVAQFVETFREFPPRQKPSSFSVDEVLASMSNAHGG